MKKLPKLSLFEILIRTPNGGQTAAADALSGCGIQRREMVEIESGNQKSLAIYTRSSKICNEVRKKIRTLGKGFGSRVTLLGQNDWYDKWQLDYQIMPLGKKFILVPFWQKEDFRPQREKISVVLDPMGTSGSGEHPTTQIMAEFLESLKYVIPAKAGIQKKNNTMDSRVRGNDEGFLGRRTLSCGFNEKPASKDKRISSCLDLGTGTGILAVLAGKLGAKKIFACDNDRRSVKAARFNLKENGIEGQVYYGDVTSKGVRPKRRDSGLTPFDSFDLVCANLISPVLEKIKKSLFAAVSRGGYLAISGIHKQNFPDFKKRFVHPKFRCVSLLQKRGWCGLLFKNTG